MDRLTKKRVAIAMTAVFMTLAAGTAASLGQSFYPDIGGGGVPIPTPLPYPSGSGTDSVLTGDGMEILTLLRALPSLAANNKLMSTLILMAAMLLFRVLSNSITARKQRNDMLNAQIEYLGRSNAESLIVMDRRLDEFAKNQTNIIMQLDRHKSMININRKLSQDLVESIPKYFAELNARLDAISPRTQ